MLDASAVPTQSAAVAPADEAQQCAQAYLQYGRALFLKAQEESDVFGAQLRDAAKQQADAMAEEMVASEAKAMEEEAKAAADKPEGGWP